jgi:hypothetical protein
MATAQTSTPGVVTQEVAPVMAPGSESERRQTIRKLQAIKTALADRREQVRSLLEQLQTADELDKDKIREQISELQQRIRELMESFEKTAVDGISLRSLEDEGDTEFDWRKELIQIAQPVLDSLKDATEKPRRIAELRTAIDLHEQQLKVAAKAIDALALLEQHEMPPTVTEGLDDVAASWRQRHDEIRHALDASTDELRFLETEKSRVFETMGGTVYEFILGRGLTLLIALVAGVFLWYVMRMLRRLANVRHRSSPGSARAARTRLLLYGYHLMTIVLVTLTILSVFYVRGDVLLLSLAIIALIMLALSVWRFLPGYIQEVRLLLNAGTAREGERLIYNGLPFRVASLSLYSELRNPDLEGVVRLPLAVLAQLTSRPDTGEAWFPCRVGDYLLMPNGDFAQVLAQTVELVRLKVVGSIVQFAAADFLQLNPRNLSREGFGVIVVFGIDYQHQDIALDSVPQQFRVALDEAFDNAGLGEDLKSLQVEFKAAGSSSLDYLVYATMDGNSAASYFAIGRLIQQTCVEVCDREGWIIPFPQLTVHRAEAAAVESVPAN